MGSTHDHNLIDRDPHFSINAKTRAITNETSSKVSLIQYDHNSERFSFEIDRYIEDHDMLQSNKVRIHYCNTGSSSRTKYLGTYEVDDLQVSPDDDTKIVFTWLISDNATKENGSLSFAISFICYEDDEVVYRWSTGINNTISIVQGMNNSDSIVDSNADILEQWWDKLYEATGGLIDQNDGDQIKIWLGTKEEYDAIPEEDRISDCIYLIKDSTVIEDIQADIEDLRTKLNTTGTLATSAYNYVDSSETTHNISEKFIEQKGYIDSNTNSISACQERIDDIVDGTISVEKALTADAAFNANYYIDSSATAQSIYKKFDEIDAKFTVNFDELVMERISNDSATYRCYLKDAGSSSMPYGLPAGLYYIEAFVILNYDDGTTSRDIYPFGMAYFNYTISLDIYYHFTSDIGINSNTTLEYKTGSNSYFMLNVEFFDSEITNTVILKYAKILD